MGTQKVLNLMWMLLMFYWKVSCQSCVTTHIHRKALHFWQFYGLPGKSSLSSLVGALNNIVRWLVHADQCKTWSVPPLSAALTYQRSQLNCMTLVLGNYLNQLIELSLFFHSYDAFAHRVDRKTKMLINEFTCCYALLPYPTFKTNDTIHSSNDAKCTFLARKSTGVSIIQTIQTLFAYVRRKRE